MFHLLLFMSVFALPVFWIWPLSTVLPVYLVLFVISVWIYIYVIKAMRRPVETGLEKSLNSTGEVLDARPDGITIWIQSEKWLARTRDSLNKGDRAQVIGKDGLVLKVQRLDSQKGLKR